MYPTVRQTACFATVIRQSTTSFLEWELGRWPSSDELPKHEAQGSAEGLSHFTTAVSTHLALVGSNKYAKMRLSGLEAPNVVGGTKTRARVCVGGGGGVATRTHSNNALKTAPAATKQQTQHARTVSRPLAHQPAPSPRACTSRSQTGRASCRGCSPSTCTMHARGSP